MLNTAQTAYAAFLETQKSADYNFEGMTAEQQKAEMLNYTKLKIAAAQEVAKNEAFLVKRAAAFKTFEDNIAAQRVALQAEWQTKEDTLR